MVTAPSIAASSRADVARKPRLDFVDNLRWVMIVLVVSMHAAVTYGHIGSWYFMEDPKPDTMVMAVFATYQVWLQAFFMGLLFFIAGYFVPAAFDRKGFGKFIADRAMRLGLPALFFMVLIQPITVYWLLRAFAEPSRPPLSRAYLPYLFSGRFLSGSGPMWFAVALLIFSTVYGMIRIALNRPPRTDPEAPLPSHGQIIKMAIVMGLCTFLVRVIQPMGTNILNMQLCFFSQYIILFTAGVYAWRHNWLLRIPYKFGMCWFRSVLSIGGVAWLVLIYVLLRTHTENKLGGGLSWQSLAFSFWESFFCVGACLGFIVLFREKFNRLGKITGWLSDNCFAVYMFHTPILIAITLGLRGFDAPKLVKFGCATALGVIATYLASSLIFRRIPLLRRIL